MWLLKRTNKVKDHSLSGYCIPEETSSEKPEPTCHVFERATVKGRTTPAGFIVTPQDACSFRGVASRGNDRRRNA